MRDNKYIVNMLSNLKKSTCGSKPVTRILEFCCDADSEIGRQAELMNNVEVFRATQELDVLTKQGLERCIEYVRAHKDVHLWGSIPCTPWSQIQNLNIAQHGESFKEYLARERSQSSNIR